jgi:hypothetical protein
MNQETDRQVFSRECLLLQNEGALTQGCFRSSPTILRAATTAERGPFYVAFFNYATGLERLLKVILVLDRLHQHGKFRNVKHYGHRIQELYQNAKNLLKSYGVEWKSSYELDSIDHRLFSFLSDFANGSRCFNLDALGGTPMARRCRALRSPIARRSAATSLTRQFIGRARRMSHRWRANRFGSRSS